MEWYIVEQYIVVKKSGSIKERTQTSAENGHRLSTKLADAHFGVYIRQLANVEVHVMPTVHTYISVKKHKSPT